MFTNHFNNSIMKQAAPGGSSSAVDALLNLKEDKTARKLFEDDNHASIVDEANARRTAGDTRPANAVYQVVLKEKWDATDDDLKLEFQKRADSMGDIEE